VPSVEGVKMEKAKLKLHNKARRLLGVDANKIRIVSPSEFRNITGYTVSTNLGIASYKHRVYYVRRGERLATYIHELLHIIYKTKPHWWLYAVSWKLANIRIKAGYGKAYGYGYGCFVDSARMKELPGKNKLLKQIQSQVKRRGLKR